MGAQNSTNYQNEALVSPTTINNNALSDLYVACFEGNSNRVHSTCLHCVDKSLFFPLLHYSYIYNNIYKFPGRARARAFSEKLN